MNWKDNYWQKTHTCEVCFKDNQVCKRIYVKKFKEPWGAFVCKECENSKYIVEHMKQYPDVELRFE